ncbi:MULTISPECIES: hypothetical protein [Dyadobacter]|uniref:Uncharacterized protein n=1 Tax=Dyadobacter chenhuakuii TaxID=2909339 RepID=A0A9X1QGL7_9BACT|nr:MULTISPECIES: hypothetical protein [Dyadobacter]MCF2501136.1 hypothetical protein [Dyadobacter chenhuakuii]MCF2519437.1 hypothetical protein [Dyadobacter sp. CY351]
MKQYDQLQSEIQITLEKIARANASIARHNAQDNPDELAVNQFSDFKRQLTEHLLELLAEMDIRVSLAA